MVLLIIFTFSCTEPLKASLGKVQCSVWTIEERLTQLEATIPKDGKNRSVQLQPQNQEDVLQLKQQNQQQASQIEQQQLVQQEHTSQLEGHTSQLEEHTSQIERLQQEHTSEIERLQQEHTSEIERLQQEHTSQLEGHTSQLQEHTSQIERLQQEHTSQLEEHTSQLEQLQEELTAHFQQQLEEQKRQIKEEMQQQFQAQLVQLQSRMQNLQPSWSIDQEHVEITERILGRGAYGEVRVGIYQGTRVAVKKIHEVIISDYNRELFEREMKIASRVRHPNLVLFIGAVTTNNITIVSELMETSLRKLMMEGKLKATNIRPISKDVACALVYLHSLPDPIVHRDVSSANVLLNAKKDGWQAKLGDFGSANFLAKLGTVGPGCVAYAAPEAVDPRQQGPKMDVYSFGVLLLEMCIGKFMDQHTLESTKVAVVTWSDPSKKSLGEWSKRCTERDPDKRPNMADFVRQF